ncbi:MAG: hypothetical protein ACKVQT_21665 [Burkholderiales bacterium]
MKIVNPMLARRVAKTTKPRNPVLIALKAGRGGAGAHVKSRGARRRAENMAVSQELAAFEKGKNHA